MTPLPILLNWLVTEPAVASYLLTANRLKLDRKPWSRVDRCEIHALRALEPVLRRFPGDRVRIRRAVEAEHPRWLFTLDVSIIIPAWIMDACDPPTLVAVWTSGRAQEWRLPLMPAPETAPAPAVRWGVAA